MQNTNTEKAIETLKSGGIVIFPTDTAVGIGCRMDDEKAVRRVFEIKKRAFDNALLVLVDSIGMAEEYVEIPDDVRKKLVEKYWPGGLSLFLKTKPGKVPGIVTAGTNVLAVRWPKHKAMEEIIREVGVPIIATSANISGDVTPYSLEQVDKTILDQADYVMEGECTYKQESTIIDLTVKPWKVVREGAVKVESRSMNQEL